MGIFIFMFIALMMTWMVSSQLPTKASRTFSWMAGFLILWLIQALRYEYIGTDLKYYIPTFINDKWDVYDVETGYVSLNRCLRSFTRDPQLLLTVVSFVSLFPISYIYKKFSKNICFSYIIFASFVVYHFTFSGLRQAIAIGIIVFSFDFVVRKKIIPFFLCVFAASLFHSSAVIFIIFYPLCNWMKLTDRKFLIGIVIGVAIIFSLKPILEILIPMIFGENKYMGYIEKDTVPAYNLIIIIFATFLFTFIVKNPSKQLQDYRVAVFCAVMCQALGLISSTATRIGYYFIPFIALAIPQALFEAHKSKAFKNLTTCGITAFMIFFFFYAYSGGSLEVIPYKFYWE